MVATTLSAVSPVFISLFSVIRARTLSETLRRRGAFEHLLEEVAVVAAQVEAGAAAVAEVARVLVAGLAHEVEDGDRPALA